MACSRTVIALFMVSFQKSDSSEMRCSLVSTSGDLMRKDGEALSVETSVFERIVVHLSPKNRDLHFRGRTNVNASLVRDVCESRRAWSTSSGVVERFFGAGGGCCVYFVTDLLQASVEATRLRDFHLVVQRHSNSEGVKSIKSRTAIDRLSREHLLLKLPCVYIS